MANVHSVSRVKIYRGESFELVGEFSYESLGASLPDGIDARYVPRAAVVHHGLIVIALERSEFVDGAYRPVGMAFVYSQDYGASLNLVDQVGGGVVVPPLADGVATDVVRGQVWSFSNPFPVDSYEDTEAAWFPWADYLRGYDSPLGGQVGLFRADRSAETGEWVVSPNRVVYEDWTEGPNVNWHAHTAAITTGGVISHWGDTDEINHTIFHALDLENYQTSSIVSEVVYGGADANQVVAKGAPQPVSAAPAPSHGEHLAAGDLTQELVMRFGALETAEEFFSIEGLITRPGRRPLGTKYRAEAPLHLHWQQGVGYVLGKSYFSPDGSTWTKVNAAASGKEFIWLYGDRIISPSGDNEFLFADLPEIETIRPMQLASGGKNELAPALEMQTAPGTGNSLRQVEYSDSLWRYTDDGAALDVQAPAPPFLSAAPVYEVTLGEQSNALGAWWLTPSGQPLDGSERYVLEQWVANLGDQTASLMASVGVPGYGGQSYNGEVGYQVATTLDWTPLGVSGGTPSGEDGRFATRLFTFDPNPGARYLVATPYFGVSPDTTYPLAPQATGANEAAAITGLSLSDELSFGLMVQLPEHAVQKYNGQMPIASFTGEGGDRVDISYEYRRYSTGNSNNATVDVEVYDDGELVFSYETTGEFLRGDVMEIVFSANGYRAQVASRINSTDVDQDIVYTELDLQLNEFKWSSADGQTVSSINPILAVFDDAMWSDAQQLDWLASGLTDKALFQSHAGAGDYNRDGVVDGADYNVWLDSMPEAVPGTPGDANLDGLVDDADATLWADSYGQAGAGLAADFNSDGRVDGADFTIWADAAKPLLPWTGADGNGDRRVDLADHQVWVDNYGHSYATIESLRAAASTISPATVESSAIVPFQTGPATTDEDSPVSPTARSAIETEAAAVVSLATRERGAAVTQSVTPSFIAEASDAQSLLLLEAAVAASTAAYGVESLESDFLSSEPPGEPDDLLPWTVDEAMVGWLRAV
ncbi:hypothetical protein [Pseudobythopirellula maris]|uniref:hypothetical protein n=1 Tax=Pseudobythopirellula maris TaxID=2527991 RepID=UPI0011B8191E|nr:hypothetical protein [Pseudobythopirellula maris]